MMAGVSVAGGAGVPELSQCGRVLLPAHDGGGSPPHLRGHEDLHRVTSQARVREGAAGAVAAERHPRLHRR